MLEYTKSVPSSLYLTRYAYRPCSFLVLFVLFVAAIEFSEIGRINASEVAFMVYALGFTLEKIAAMQEHGIKG